VAALSDPGEDGQFDLNTGVQVTEGVSKQPVDCTVRDLEAASSIALEKKNLSLKAILIIEAILSGLQKEERAEIDVPPEFQRLLEPNPEGMPLAELRHLVGELERLAPSVFDQ
jgi:hypothetical protein